MQTETPEEVRQYFQTQVQPIFSTLMHNLIINRPEDIKEYVQKYFNTSNKILKDVNDSSDDQDRFEEISQEEFDIRKTIKRQNAVRKFRKGVSSQANQMFTAQRKPISLRPAGLKDQKTQIMISFYFMDSFLFHDFEAEQKQFLINSMVAQKTTSNETVIKEGQYGSCMYFVESGLFECSIEEDSGLKGNNTRVLRNYQAGDIFGQLCLLHAAKRQASVISRTEGVLYSLTRQVYRHVRKMSIVKKRELHIQNLKKVNILSNLSAQDFEKLCDLLHEDTFEANEYVIHQGDMGTKFYIVIQGLLAAKSSQQDTFYQYYKQGDYFGELALITKKPRQVSVQAVTKCRLVSLSSRVFLNVINLDKAHTEMNQKYRQGRVQTLGGRRRKVNNSVEHKEYKE